MKDATHYEQVLKERLAELSNRLHDVEAELDRPADADDEERAVERESDETLESLGSLGLSEIRQIEAALKRISDGKFGLCAECGEQILEERLDMIPHAATCRFCARGAA